MMAGFFVLLGFAALIVLIFFLKRFFPAEVYERNEKFLSPAELHFMKALLNEVGEKYHVMCKIRLGDILKVREHLHGKKWRSAYNKILCKHVDFVLCSKENFEIMAVIELDDRSHEREDRKERDEFVDNAMKDAHIPIFHIPVQKNYSLSGLFEK